MVCVGKDNSLTHVTMTLLVLGLLWRRRTYVEDGCYGFIVLGAVESQLRVVLQRVMNSGLGFRRAFGRNAIQQICMRHGTWKVGVPS